MNNIIKFPGFTIGPIPVEDVLSGYKSFKDVFVIGIEADGNIVLGTSEPSDIRAAIGLLEIAKSKLLDLYHES